jgi:hypothetical protein
MVEGTDSESWLHLLGQSRVTIDSEWIALMEGDHFISLTRTRLGWSNPIRTGSFRSKIELLEEPAHSILGRFRLGPNPSAPSSPPHPDLATRLNAPDEIDRLLELL